MEWNRTDWNRREDGGTGGGDDRGLVSYVYLFTYFLYCERMCEDSSSAILGGEGGGREGKGMCICGMRVVRWKDGRGELE